MIQFRKDMPTIELLALIDHFRGGKKLSTSEMISHVFEIISYGLGQALPSDKALVGDVQFLSEADLADALECCLPCETGTVKTAIPWAIIVPVLMKIFEKVVEKYLKEGDAV